ncbi:MAG: DMT family transporter [Opitutales bacterium]
MSSTATSHARHVRSLLLMLFSTACFTANVLLVRALGPMHAANAWLVSSARFVVGLAFVLIFFRAEVQPSHLVRNRLLIHRGLFGGVTAFLTYLTVVKIGAGRAIFIGNTYVIWGALLAAWLLKERLRSTLIGGAVAALAGLALLTNIFTHRAHPGLYDLLAVVGALLSAWVVVTIRQLHATEHTSTIFTAQCAYGLLICAGPTLASFAPVSPAAWVMIGLAGLAATGGQLSFTHAFRDLSVAEGSLLQMIVPLGVALGGVLLFHEHFTSGELLGAVLILAGTALPAWQGRPLPPSAVS